MKHIHKFGTSVSETQEQARTRRVNVEPKKADLNFAGGQGGEKPAERHVEMSAATLFEHARPMLGIVISLLDKTIAKPPASADGKKPGEVTQELHDFRDALGRRLWEKHLKPWLAEQSLGTAIEPCEEYFLKQRLHPYKVSDPPTDKTKGLEGCQGRKYGKVFEDRLKCFSKDCPKYCFKDCSKNCVKDCAKNCCLGKPKDVAKNKTAIEKAAAQLWQLAEQQRAKTVTSITSNVSLQRTLEAPAPLAQSYIDAYCQKPLDEIAIKAYGNVVEKIAEAMRKEQTTQFAKKQQHGKNKHKKKSGNAPESASDIVLNIAQLKEAIFATLHKHGTAVWKKYKQANPENGGFKHSSAQPQTPMAVHLAVKDFYTQQFEGHAKPDVIAERLPKSIDGVINKINARRCNRTISHLIRLGKVITYENNNLAYNPNDGTVTAQQIAESAFWDSEGLSLISVNEAFNHSWRRLHAMMLLTLNDWARGHGEDIEDSGDDLLLEKGRQYIKRLAEHVTGNVKISEHLQQKWWLLFVGHDSGLPPEDILDRMLAMRDVLEKWRNTTFHFQRHAEVVKSLALTELETEEQAALVPFRAIAAELWKNDHEKRQQRLVETLHAAHVHEFFDVQQIKQIWALLHSAPLTDTSQSEPPTSDPEAPQPLNLLPRFNRIVTRAKGASWQGFDSNNATLNEEDPAEFCLPLPAKNIDLQENPGESKEQHALARWKTCQYTVLKRLYETQFGPWLAQKEDAKPYFDNFYEIAFQRATEAAKEATKEDNPQSGDQKVVARMERIALPAEDSDDPNKKPRPYIDTLTYALFGETAREMGVQNHYSSDKEKAQKQAKYVENLRCDMLVLAYRDFLLKQNLTYLVPPTPAEPRLETPKTDSKNALDALAKPSESAPSITTEGELAPLLYAMLHLVPVHIVNEHYHQLRRWQLALHAPRRHKSLLPAKDESESANTLLRPYMAAIELYRDMHDAQFDENTPIRGIGKLRELYADKTDFDRVFPNPQKQDAQTDATQNDTTQTAFRAVREYLRFTRLPALEALVGKRFKVQQKSVNLILGREDEINDRKGDINEREVEIIKKQRRRIALHDKVTQAHELPTKPNDEPQSDITEYTELVRDIKAYRDARHEAQLTDLVRISELFIAAWSRLGGFQWRFERDMNFAYFALLFLNTHTEGALIPPAQREKRLKKNPSKSHDNHEIGLEHIKQALEELGFTDQVTYFPNDKSLRKHRNKIAHPNFTKKDKPLNLLALINDTRKLMAYDRKSRNAVISAINNLFEQENIGANFTLDLGTHDIKKQSVKAKRVKHLQSVKMPKDDKNQRMRAPQENLQSDRFCELVYQVLSPSDDCNPRPDFGRKSGGKPKKKPWQKHKKKHTNSAR